MITTPPLEPDDDHCASSSTAARNLQRPELDWRKSYAFRSDRDAQVFDAEPVAAILDPPLSFVHSITASTQSGDELRLMLYVFNNTSFYLTTS